MCKQPARLQPGMSPPITNPKAPLMPVIREAPCDPSQWGGLSGREVGAGRRGNVSDGEASLTEALVVTVLLTLILLTGRAMPPPPSRGRQRSPVTPDEGREKLSGFHSPQKQAPGEGRRRKNPDLPMMTPWPGLLLWPYLSQEGRRSRREGCMPRNVVTVCLNMLANIFSQKQQ